MRNIDRFVQMQKLINIAVIARKFHFIHHSTINAFDVND